MGVDGCLCVCVSSGLQLSMALHQLCILFYCETPGDVGPAEGMTGIFRSSHLSVMEALRQYIAAGHGVVPGDTFTRAVKLKFGTERGGSLVQPILRNNSVMLLLGPLVHCVMWARDPMPGANVRVLQNCKVVAHKDLRNSNAAMLELIRRVPPDAMLRQVYTKPLVAADAAGLPAEAIAKLTTDAGLLTQLFIDDAMLQ